MEHRLSTREECRGAADAGGPVVQDAEEWGQLARDYAQYVFTLLVPFVVCELNPCYQDPNIGTTLYSHQKKALTFLLLREREITDSEGKFSSLWDARKDIRGNKVWVHLVTEKETFEEPVEAKGAILADDVSTAHHTYSYSWLLIHLF